MRYLIPTKHSQFVEFIEKLNMDDCYKKDAKVLQVLAEQFESFDYDQKIGRAKNIELEF